MTSGLKYAENWNVLKYSFGLKREVGWSCFEEVCSEHLKTNTHASPLDITITIYVKTWKTWSCSQRKLFKWLKMFHVSEIIWQLLCEVTGEKWLWLEPAATSKIWCHHCHRVCVTGEVLSWVIWSYFIALSLFAGSSEFRPDCKEFRGLQEKEKCNIFSSFFVCE